MKGGIMVEDSMDRRGFLGRMLLLAVTTVCAAVRRALPDAERSPGAGERGTVGVSRHRASHYRELAG